MAQADTSYRVDVGALPYAQMKYDLTIFIPSRNEMFLGRTLEDLLAHIEGKTEIIVVLDGAPSLTPLPIDPRLTVISLPESIGQRGTMNLAIKLSKAKYVMKTDAHTAWDQGFDVKLMADMQDDWTMVPVMRNLHAFDWVCEDGHRRYQGPSGPCTTCQKPTTRDIVWNPKTNPQSKAYAFDSEPHFQYATPKDKGDLTETMSLQGSCFMLTREKYWELGICDEAMGSWGSQGIEVAVKTWLSGGRVIVNHKTWYAHLFRTSGGDFGFPYALSGNQVAKAKKMSRDLFFYNQWPLQVKPLSWLLERFWPVRGWSERDLRVLQEAGAVFTNLRAEKLRVPGVVPVVPSPMTDQTPSMSSDGIGQEMPVPAMSLAGIPSTESRPSQDILSIRDQAQMRGIATGSVVTDVVEDRDIPSLPIRDGADQPRINESMSAEEPLVHSNLSISRAEDSEPIPTSSSIVYSDLLKKSIDSIGRDVHDTSIASKGVVYFSDCRLDEKLLKDCQTQLRKAFPGKIVSVTLKPSDFGENIHMPLERGKLTMFKQILAGLEALDTDYVFLCDDDVLYHPSHFEFTPTRNDTYYYNLGWWRLRTSDGFAVHYDAKQSNFLVANRKLMIEEYKERVRRTEIDGAPHGGYEPGTRSIRRGGFSNSRSETYRSELPSIDIRHGKNMTHSKWKPEEFAQARSCPNWVNGTIDDIKGWDNLGAILGI